MLWKGATSSAAGPPPLWLGVLQMAEAWGCHPEDIMTRPGGLKWAARWGAYRKEVRWVEEQK